MDRKIPRKWHKFFGVIAESDKELVMEKLTTKNLFILYLVHKLRCISPKELSRLLDQPIKHSLVDLTNVEKIGLLYSDYTEFYGCTQRVFFTTNEGIEKIAELLGTTVYRLDKELDKYVPNFYSQYENKISPSYMPHFLATNDFFLTLLKNEIYVDWKDGRFNSLFDGGLRKAPIRVDASYMVGNDFYGVEQDMGTADKTRTLTKFSNYANYFPITNFDNSTIYFPINMGKYLNPKKLNQLSKQFTDNEMKLKELRIEKKRYTEAKKLIKEYPAPPSVEELTRNKELIEKILKSHVVSRQERRRQEKALVKIKALLNSDYPKPEDDLQAYEELINNPVLSEAEKRKAKIKKEIILTYKEISRTVDIDEKISEITLQMRELKAENDKMKADKEINMLIELAHRRRETVMSYIDFQIKNNEGENILLDLFRKGLDLYMDESILLAKFAAKQLKKETSFDYLTKYISTFIKSIFDGINNTVNFDGTRKAKYENLTFTIDYSVKIHKQQGNIVYIDVFDICDNNIASLYRFKEYMEVKYDERGLFTNRLVICLVNSKDAIFKVKEEFPHIIDNVWFQLEDYTSMDFDNMFCFKDNKLELVKTEKDLVDFLRKIN